MTQQVSVFLENKVGRLEYILQILYDNDIDLRSISVAETSDYGVFRLILDKPQIAIEKLKEAGLIVRETEVLALEIDDAPGSMLRVIKELTAGGISVEYTYSCLPIHEDKVIIIIRVDNLEKAVKSLQSSNSAKIVHRI